MAPPRGIEYFFEAFVKRTRTSQKISKISGSILTLDTACGK